MLLSPIRHQPFTPQQQRVGNESLTTNQTKLLALLDTAQSWLKKIPNWSGNTIENEAFFTFFSTFFANKQTFEQGLNHEEQDHRRIKQSIRNFNRLFSSHTQSFYRIYHPILEQKLKQYKTDINSKEITTRELLNAEISKIASWREPLQTLGKDLRGPALSSYRDISTTFDEIRQKLLPPRPRPKP
jgi:hypothetical protein